MSDSRSPFFAAKVVACLVWAVAIGAHFVGGDSIWMEALRATAYVLLATHALETLLVLPVLRRAEGPLRMHVAQMLIFGMIHYGELSQRSKS